MKHDMLKGLSRLALRTLAALQLSLLSAAFAIDSKPVEPENGEQATGQAAARRSLQFQELEDVVAPLDPVRQRTVSDEARLDALASFARGCVLHRRGDLAGALAAYEKAVESDPTAISVYRVLIRLAVELRQVDDAIKWVTKATEADPADPQFLTQAVALLVDRRDLAGAIRVLDRASRVPGIDKHSLQYVGIMRDLAVLNIEEDHKLEAVAGLEVVFDALTNPDKYKIPPEARTRLLNDKLISFERMGQVFLDAKKTDLALAAFQKAAESKKGRAAAGNLSYNLAQVYLQADEPEQALAELQKYIDSQRLSKERGAYELLARILARLDRSAELIPRLEAAAEKDSRNSFLQFFLADQYAEQNRLDDAEALYKRTLETSADVQGYLGLAGVYRRQRRAAELLEVLIQAYSEAGDLKPFATEFKSIIADPNLVESLMKSATDRLNAVPPRLDFASGYLLANIAADARQSELAEKLYRYLLPLKKERAGLIYEELGSHFFEVKNYAQAVKVYDEAAEDPDLTDSRPIFLVLGARAMELAGDTKRALETIQAAQDLAPNNPFFRFQEGWIYYHAHKFDEAIERMERLIADFPQRQPEQLRRIVRSAQSSLSNIYVMKGEIRKGEEILEAVYHDDPEDVSVNNDLGYLYADQGKNLEQAESMIRKAVAAEPDNGAYLDSLGWVLFKRGKYDEALPWLEKAVKNSPGAGDETLWEHLGDVHESLQHAGHALDAWKQSLELGGKAQFPDQKLIERVKEKITAAKDKPDEK
jgi:tetratricopeptide (TPR) repeat protein